MADTQVPTTPTILVVEDSAEMRDVLRRAFESCGFVVETARDGEEALQKCLDLQPSLVMLDIALPKRNGFEVARALRRRGFGGRILMLTALDSVADKITGLEAGADDYLSKPFDAEELMARVKALLRRGNIGPNNMLLQAGDLTLNPLTMHATRAGHTIVLTGKEYALLALLMQHAGRTLTFDEITQRIWGQPYDPVRNHAAVYMRYLRQKIDDPALGPPLLRTVRGRGYMIKD